MAAKVIDFLLNGGKDSIGVFGPLGGGIALAAIAIGYPIEKRKMDKMEVELMDIFDKRALL